MNSGWTQSYLVFGQGLGVSALIATIPTLLLLFLLAGARKPAPEFFQYALGHCGLTRDDVLFVGNQLNSDITGGEAFGIRTVWLCGPAYRSLDDAPCSASPTHTIETLYSLPALVQTLQYL